MCACQAAVSFLRRRRRRIGIPSPIASSSSRPSETAATAASTSVSSRVKSFYEYGGGGGGGGSHWWWWWWRRRNNGGEHLLCKAICGPTAIILAMNANPVLADISVGSSENQPEGASITGVCKVEDSSVISNMDSWELVQKGKLDKAEIILLSALQEAKKSFGKRDIRVALACKNLADLYTFKKTFDKAETLYLEAITIVEESIGPEDIRVGYTLHNLGVLYVSLQKLEEACKCYKRALKIMGRVLGYHHAENAEIMFRLGKVLYLQGKETDAEIIIQDSIRILEEGGQGQSVSCVTRLQYLAQIYRKSNRLAEAECLQRKILHIMEISKGWNSMETVAAAEGLARVLQSQAQVPRSPVALLEAQDLLERCLDARRTLLPDCDIQIVRNMIDVSMVALLNSDRLRNMHLSEAVAELDRVKDLLCDSARIARKALNKYEKQNGKQQNIEEAKMVGCATLAMMLQSFYLLGGWELFRYSIQMPKAVSTLVTLKFYIPGPILKMDFEKTMTWKNQTKGYSPERGFEDAILDCISTYKKFESQRSISDCPEVKMEYLGCLKLLFIYLGNMSESNQASKRKKAIVLEGVDKEIKRIEGEIKDHRRRRP